MANKIKYFYNGELIRTSTHIYTHAVIDQKGKCIACRNGLANAQKAKDAERCFANGCRKYAEEAIRALQAGKSHFFYREGRGKAMHTFKSDDTIERYQKNIAWADEVNKKIDGYQIVELEAR